ncbi:hypothetical protein [Lysobacter sp. TAB13]|uniref:hypothetical protein n=1 Tax=Lysobacter sp. TAB13 TaxID=3233065 RepID=UPI003F9BA329
MKGRQKPMKGRRKNSDSMRLIQHKLPAQQTIAFESFARIAMNVIGASHEYASRAQNSEIKLDVA